MGQETERHLPEEWDEIGYEAAEAVKAIMEPVRTGETIDSAPDDAVASRSRRWTVAVPVVLEHGAVVNDSATHSATRPLLLDDPPDATALEPGTPMRVVGGTRGHILWPPATEVFEVLEGPLRGVRVEFVLEPDPRPAGRLACAAALAIIALDEPVLGDPERLAALRDAFGTALRPLGGRATPDDRRANGSTRR